MAEVENSHWWYGATRQHLRQLLDPFLPTVTGPSNAYFDIGGGTGATGAWLEEFGTVYNVDVEPVANQLSRDYHASIQQLTGSVTALPIADNVADGALCVTVLCHRSIADPVDAVRELARITKPGGWVCLWEPGVRALRRAHDDVTHTARRFSRRDLADAARQAGLIVERSTGAHVSLVPLAAAKAVIELPMRKRGENASDLAKGQVGLHGVLPALATLERKALRSVSLPFGLSAVCVATKPL
jgi:SAM-dependent methyltransferase